MEINSLFLMVAVHHFEFEKIVVLVTCLYLHAYFHISAIWLEIACPPTWICYDVIVLHQRTAFHVPNFMLNFHGVRLRKF